MCSMSIWDLTIRDTFEKDVATLYAKTSSQSHRLAQLPPGPSQPNARLQDVSTTALAADTESQLADDFAFLASWEGIPPCVSAATVTQIDETGGICLSVASNEGISHDVEQSFRQILSLLEQCASCRISRSTCEERLLVVIIRFHRNRIFERLGSSKAIRSTRELRKQWPVRGLKPILPRLKAWIPELQLKASRQRNDQDIPILARKAQSLHTAIFRAETLHGDAEHAALISIVHAASSITERSDGRSLQAQFRLMGFDNDFTSRKEFREINAIANYGRICSYLTKASRSYHRLFRRTILNVVAHNIPTCWRGTKRFVHAEIQLLIDHEIHPRSFAARSIGTSKRACLLCYLFLRAHGAYEVPQTHGEVMPQWTVPDPSSYSADSLERIRMALRVMVSDLGVANKTAVSMQGNTPSGLVCIGAHSTEHLHFAPLRTPSMATLASVRDGVLGTTTIVDRPPIGRTQELPEITPVDSTSGMPPAELGPQASLGISMPEVLPAISEQEEVPTTTPITKPLSKTPSTAAAAAATPAMSTHTTQPTSTITPNKSPTPPPPLLIAPDSGTDLNKPPDTTHITISPTTPKMLQFDGCEIHLQFENLLATQQDLTSTADVSQPVYQEASCAFRMQRPEDEEVVITDSARISSEENTVLEGDENGKVFEFGLRGRSGLVAIIAVRWLPSTPAES